MRAAHVQMLCHLIGKLEPPWIMFYSLLKTTLDQMPKIRRYNFTLPLCAWVLIQEVHMTSVPSTLATWQGHWFPLPSLPIFGLTEKFKGPKVFQIKEMLNSGQAHHPEVGFYLLCNICSVQ